MAASGGYRCGKLYKDFLSSGGAGERGVMLGVMSLKLFGDPDTVDPNSKTARSHLSDSSEMTGLQRLKFMFSYDGYGNLSPEIATVIQSGLMGVFTGTVIGGTLHSRESYLSFIERNQGTAFQNMFDAQKQLQTKVTIGFGRGAWMWGWRLGLFCSTFMLFTSSIQTYRGKSSFLEYSAGGILTGAVYKLKLGPKAAVAGAVLGGALGTLAGCFNMAILYLTGTSTDQMRKYRYQLQEEQQMQRLSSLREARAQDLDLLSQAHQSKTVPNKDILDAVDDTDMSTK